MSWLRSPLRAGLLGLILLVAGCVAPEPQTAPQTARQTAPDTTPSGLPTPETAADNFFAVVARVEPVAEAVCRERAPRLPCDFQIVVDGRPWLPPNAYQTLDRRGRPIVAFTIALVASAQNRDELAFILGHEAAHHIQGHLPKARASAKRAAVLAGAQAQAEGRSRRDVRRAQSVGAEIGRRIFSKAFELEADALGTVIAFRAGYDPARGAAYFQRLPDPGDVFLGTHPPNAERVATVRRVLGQLRRGARPAI